jgi:hypothetical protein
MTPPGVNERGPTMPLRLREEPADAAHAIADARSRLRRVLAMGEGTESYLQEYGGCEVDHGQMLAAFGVIVEEAQHALALLDQAAVSMRKPESAS